MTVAVMSFIDGVGRVHHVLRRKVAPCHFGGGGSTPLYSML
jgi:hypothetical protein